jgi:type I restriction enzyme S subunit
VTAILPIDWTVKTLAEVCSVVMGQSPPSSSYNMEGKGLPFFQGKAEFGFLYPETIKWCTEPKKVAKKDDVLISVRAPVGPTNLAPSECCIGRGLAAIRPLGDMPSKYILYYLRNIVSQLEVLGTGTTFKAISAPILKNLPVPIAPSNEQKLIIAEIEKQFSRLDEAVAGLKRVKANLKRYKAAVLKAAIEGKLTEEWRKQNPDVEHANELLKRILAERKKKWEAEHPGNKYKEPAHPDTLNLPELPKGWVWATLSQLGELNRGKSKHRPRNAPHLYGGHYPFVQTGDIKSATGVIREYRQTYSEEGLKQSRLWPKGTLCITIAANIADTTILGFDACFPDSIVGFISESENVDTRFIEYFFRTAKENIERFAPATAQKNINLEILNDVAIPLPSVSEQQAIINEIEQRLSVTEEIEDAVEINLKRAERLRQSILKKAFSGKLVSIESNEDGREYLAEIVTL